MNHTANTLHTRTLPKVSASFKKHSTNTGPSNDINPPIFTKDPSLHTHEGRIPESADTFHDAT